jgi:hypothetical protein
MRKSLAFAVLLTVPLAFGAAPALAFQETSDTPPAEAQEAAKDKPQSQSMPPAMKLGSPADALQPEPEHNGLFGFGLLPKLNPFSKLNFGLDVLYGDKQEQPELQQQGSKADESGDVSAAGKAKRKF